MPGVAWKAPKEDGGLLFEANRGVTSGLLEEILHYFRECKICFSGTTLTQLRQQFREELRLPANQPIIASGHQPEMFHPGVWIKNAITSLLAKQAKGVGCHYIVDHDLCKSTTISLPLGSHFERALVKVPFSEMNSARPFEEAYLDSPKLFENFAEQILLQSQHWNWQPVIGQVWPKAIEFQRKHPKLPWHASVSHVRHALEESWDMTNQERLMSVVSKTKPFLTFVMEFVQRAEEFHQIHNEELQKYRQEKRIRGKNRPVAFLAKQGDAVELPFWIWRKGETQRYRLFTVPGKLLWTSSEGPQELAIENIDTLQNQNLKLRPRALTNSLFLKLIASDVFVHGLGGAIYDQLGDVIFSRFLKAELPRFLVATATLRLPWQPAIVDQSAERSKLKEQLRRMRFEPELFVKSDSSQEILKLRERLHTLSQREQHLRREELRTTLRESLKLTMYDVQHRLDDLTHCGLNYKQLTSREFPWVLYPEDALVSLLNQSKSIRL